VPKKFTYSGNPADGPLHAVRFLIGDVFESHVMFGDDEINYQLAKTPNQSLCGAELLDIKSRQLARLADRKVGDVSSALSKLSESMATAAKELRNDALRRAKPFFGGLTISGKQDLSQRTDDVQPQFSIGMHDTPGVAQLNDDVVAFVRVYGAAY
jgi:hypothetical protein